MQFFTKTFFIGHIGLFFVTKWQKKELIYTYVHMRMFLKINETSSQAKNNIGNL